VTLPKPQNQTSANFKLTVKKWPKVEPHRIMADFGDVAVRIIRKRAQGNGRQSDGSPLAPYKDDYRKELRKANEGTRRDLTLSGKLWKAFRVLRVRLEQVVIGWSSSTRSPNTVRTKGGTHVGRGAGQRHVDIIRRLEHGTPNMEPRPFFGISKSDRKKLARWLQQKKPRFFRKG